ncbi:MAG: hypothetical protein V4686_00105 [Patescibacteria group bacterium]
MTPEIYSWKKPFFSAAACLFVLLILNDVAVQLALYWGYKWLDIPFHFIGGFGVGLASIGLLRIAFPGEKYINSPQLLYTVLLTLFVGASWEAVETYYDVSVLFGGNFWFDTYKDLLMDTLGGILSYICFHPRKKNL